MNTKMERLLHSVQVNEHGPGSILRDFETLLGFVGVDGIKASGKHGFLPMSCLKDLNERLTRPLGPALQRPKQESYPHIHGLYLLLRATGLGVVRGTGTKSRLHVDSEILSLWRQLNPTERYFNLLEAWLFIASREIWGRPTRWGSSLVHEVYQLAELYLIDRRNRDTADDIGRFMVDQQAHVALFEMFGFVVLECQPPQPKENWRVVSAKCTDFGTGILQLLKELVLSPEFMRIDDEHRSFGILQPFLGPHFPAWESNLVHPEPEFRDGVYHFKVSWNRTWRRIAIPASCDFEDLANTILDAYDFDDDHLYCFTLRDRFGKRLAVEHPACDADVFADGIAIGAAPIGIGETIEFLYDFGDEWLFVLNLERIDGSDSDLHKPQLMESHGNSPPQYDYGDDGDEDWD